MFVELTIAIYEEPTVRLGDKVWINLDNVAEMYRYDEGYTAIFFIERDYEATMVMEHPRDILRMDQRRAAIVWPKEALC